MPGHQLKSYCTMLGVVLTFFVIVKLYDNNQCLCFFFTDINVGLYQMGEMTLHGKSFNIFTNYNVIILTHTVQFDDCKITIIDIN